VTEALGFIGDIHGESKLLTELLPVALLRARRLVFLGDYVDRGPDSFGVLEILCNLAESKEGHVFLRGNHDDAMADAIDHGRVDQYLRQGGAGTVAQYVQHPEPDLTAQFAASVPARHRKFLHELQDSFAAHDVSASHVPPRSSGSIATFHVSAHRPHGSFEPLVSDREAWIDTGAGTMPGGRLTCLFWPSMAWIQTTPATVSAAF